MSNAVRERAAAAGGGVNWTDRVLLIENCDFRSFPPGGQLSFSRQMVRAFGERLALVGVTTEGEPTGRWIERKSDQGTLPFFAVGRVSPGAGKPLVPARLTFFLRLRMHRRRILETGVRYAMALAPETMMAVRNWGLEVCYHFSGVENPLAGSRYGWARPLAAWFDAAHLGSARKARLLLVHADEASMAGLAARSKGILQPEDLVKFPTCVDPEVFHPIPKRAARQALGLPLEAAILACVGRIGRRKGWDLLLESFAQFRRSQGEAQLWFIGDGEDRRALERAAEELGLGESVRITGFQGRDTVVLYLNAADVVLFGSHREGWSNAMLEALACGKPIVSTEVSGAREMIMDGANGFVVGGRDPGVFASSVREAMRLASAEVVSLEVAARYGVEKAAADLRALWPPLGEAAGLESPGGRADGE